MSNQGIYREAGGAGGLPFPRANMTGLTVVLVMLAAVGTVMPMLMMVGAGGGMSGAWRLFRDGGGWMWLILLCGLVGPAVAAVLGALLLRGRQIPAGILFVGAGVSFVVALIGAWAGQRMVMGAISGESVDPEQKARILAEGISETMSTDLFGGFVVCATAVVAAVGAASAVAAIDRNAAARGNPAPSSFGALGSGIAGGLWVLATIVLCVLRVRAAGGLVLVTVLPVLVLVPFAILAGRNAGVLRDWHDKAEASRMSGAIAVAGLCALLAVLALSRAVESSFTARALGAISGESVDDSQRARILAYALDAGQLAPVSYAIHVVLGAATFGLALAPSLGNGRNPARPSVVGAAMTGVLLLVATLALARSRTAAPRMLASMKTDPSIDGINLPVTADAFSHRGTGPRYGDSRLLMRADGTSPPGTGDTTLHEDYTPSSTCLGTTSITVFGDRAATLAMLRPRLGAPSAASCEKKLTFVLKGAHPPDLDARLGDYAGFLGRTQYMNASIDDDPDNRTVASMKVKMVADDALEVDGTRVQLPLPSSADTGKREQVTHVYYVFRPTDTLDRVIATISKFESTYSGSLSSWELTRSIDDGVRPPAKAPVGSLVGSEPTVSGRLPPEVIQRVVRQSTARMRICYEKGLRRDPDLQGRVVVKFVIDRSGDVSTAADGGSDLADSSVVSCIVHTFQTMLFPAPEAGIVTVTYPLNFYPKK